MSVTTPSTAQSVGLSRSGLYREVEAGRYERIARGIYLPADAPAADWDIVEAAQRRNDATICLISALVHHNLIDTVPSQLDVAIRRGSRSPVTHAAIVWHQFDVATFEVGREEVIIEGTNLTIGLYSPERCLADAYRLRGQIGYEIGRDALKEWLRQGGKPATLLSLAKLIPRSMAPLRRDLEVLT